MKFDELLFTNLGEFGRYQKIQFVLVCLPIIFVSMHALSWTFSAAFVPHRFVLSFVLRKSFQKYTSTKLYI